MSATSPMRRATGTRYGSISEVNECSVGVHLFPIRAVALLTGRDMRELLAVGQTDGRAQRCTTRRSCCCTICPLYVLVHFYPRVVGITWSTPGTYDRCRAQQYVSLCFFGRMDTADRAHDHFCFCFAGEYNTAHFRRSLFCV